MMRDGCPHRHSTVRMERAYTKLQIQPVDRRWWHRFVRPKVPNHYCRKCHEPLRHLDVWHYDDF